MPKIKPINAVITNKRVFEMENGSQNKTCNVTGVIF